MQRTDRDILVSMFDRMTTAREDSSEVENILTIVLEMLCSQDKESHRENVRIFQVSNGCL